MRLLRLPENPETIPITHAQVRVCVRTCCEEDPSQCCCSGYMIVSVSCLHVLCVFDIVWVGMGARACAWRREEGRVGMDTTRLGACMCVCVSLFVSYHQTLRCLLSLSSPRNAVSL